MSVKELVKRTLTEKENKAYWKRLSKLQVTYGHWIAGLEAKKAKELGRLEPDSTEREFVVICASKGCLSRNAIKNIECYFKQCNEVQLLYGDEDVWPGYGQSAEKADAFSTDELRIGERSHPWFKPDWSPDLLDSCLYFGSVIVLRKELFDKVQDFYRSACYDEGLKLLKGEGDNDADCTAGGHKIVCHAAADLALYERLVHDCAELAGAYKKGSRAVGHVPAILFHSESEKEQEKFFGETPRVQHCRAEYARDFRDGWVARKAEGVERDPVVSVVIPSKDQPDILEKCLRSCLLAACVGQENSLPLEIILVDNGSSEENRGCVEALTEELSAPEFRIQYLYRPMEFHFSKMCNLGSGAAKGRFLLFLNDDVELCQPGCIEKMAALADRWYTGAVGIKLRYPDSARIQHAGITNLPMGPVHKLQFLDDNNCYYYNSNRGWRNVLAVTGACLMVEKDKFQEAGGFSEELRVAFNDVDLSFRLYELGYLNVCMNDLYACHHESLSRGDDESAEKLERLLAERDKLYSMHPELEGVDPYYSEFLNREGLDTQIRPAFMTAGNRLQEVKVTPLLFNSQGCRQDECLLVRVEECKCGKVRGYSVVLGDDNACYEKGILFEKKLSVVDDSEFQGETPVEIYVIATAEQYRPDLEENMPDQVNVGLSGFAVKLEQGILPPGSYRLGAVARNRITGLRLINWSNRVCCVEE